MRTNKHRRGPSIAAWASVAVLASVSLASACAEDKSSLEEAAEELGDELEDAGDELEEAGEEIRDEIDDRT